MSKYKVMLSDRAEHDILRHRVLGSRAILQKIRTLLLELEDHPRTGTGKPELLVGCRKGQWSRRITQKHRLIYEIHESIVTVLLLSAWGHYDAK